MSFETPNTEIKAPLKLHGFIEYFPLEKGFVTPVFKDDSHLFIQVISDDSRIQRFEALSEIYFNEVQQYPLDKSISTGDNCLFGFKQPDGMHFDVAEKLSQYLFTELDNLVANHYLFRNVQAFIKKYDTTGRLHRSIIPDAGELWKFCLDTIIGRSGQEFAQVFSADIKSLQLSNNTLRVEFKSSETKSAFRNNCRIYLVDAMKEAYGPGYDLEIVDKYQIFISYSHQKLDLELVPGLFPVQGSFIAKTRLEPLKTFENFILTKSNAEAYTTAWDFVSKINEPGQVIIIFGESKSGKSYLMEAVEHYLRKQRKQEPAAFRGTDHGVFYENTKLRNYDEYSRLADRAVTILVDDMHLLDRSDPFHGEYWTSIKELSNAGKNILMTYNRASADLGLYYPKFEFSKIAMMMPPDFSQRMEIASKIVHAESFDPLRKYLFKSLVRRYSDIDFILNRAMELLLTSPTKGFLAKPFELFKTSGNKAILYSGITDLYKITGDIVDVSLHNMPMCYDPAFRKEIIEFTVSLWLKLNSEKHSPFFDKYIFDNEQFDLWRQQLFDNRQIKDFITEIYSGLKKTL